MGGGGGGGGGWWVGLLKLCVCVCVPVCVRACKIIKIAMLPHFNIYEEVYVKRGSWLAETGNNH